MSTVSKLKMFVPFMIAVYFSKKVFFIVAYISRRGEPTRADDFEP